jgi:hypothetical protein
MANKLAADLDALILGVESMSFKDFKKEVTDAWKRRAAKSKKINKWTTFVKTNYHEAKRVLGDTATHARIMALLSQWYKTTDKQVELDMMLADDI